jgi:hypothetical protein
MHTYVSRDPIVANRPLSITERDEQGALVGAWIGYYNYKRFEIALYPDFKNKFVQWRVQPGKKIIPANRVKYDKPPQKENTPKSQTSSALHNLKDLPGQTKFKF